MMNVFLILRFDLIQSNFSKNKIFQLCFIR